MGDIMRQSLALFTCIAPVVLIAPLTLQAADEPLERIIVTAQKRETDLQDVPFSVSATSEEQIRNSGASSVVELSRNVSGLIMTDLGPGTKSGGDSRHQCRPGRPGSAWREGVGRCLPRRIAHLALRCSRPIWISSILRGSRCCVVHRARCSVRAPQQARCATSRSNPDSENSNGAAEVTASTGTDSEFGWSAKGALNVPLGGNAAMRARWILQRARRFHRFILSRPRRA